METVNRLTRHVPVVGLLVVMFCGAGTGVVNAECLVTVRSPAQGATVDWEVLVEGTAKLPAGSFLWVFIGPRGQNDWWPQGGGPAELNPDGAWEVLARLGDRQEDAGKSYAIVPVVVDRTTHGLLQTYIRRGRDTGQWPSFSALPGVVGGCPLVKVNVRRAQ